MKPYFVDAVLCIYMPAIDRSLSDCRYQCDGFFTGAKPPWYDAVAASTSETAEASALAAVRTQAISSTM